MKVFITTLGTRGDVQPYVALGQGLQAAGHTVTICTSASFEPFVRDHGLRYGHMTDELMRLVDSDSGREAMENTTGLFAWLQTAVKMMGDVKPLQRQLLLDSWAAAQEADPDVVISHPKSFGGPSIAEKLGVPAMLAQPLPMLVPTATMPNIVFPRLPLGGWYNRLTYTLALKGARAQYGGLLQEFRRETLDLPKLPRGSDDLHMADGTPIPVLHAFSEHVLPRPEDWPAHVHVTGYWFLERTGEWRPPAGLLHFLDNGPPPVYVGFGSMSGRDPRRITRIVIDALQQAGVRGIIATGWGGLDADTLPESIFKLEQAPHDWLFPRTAAVIHHGGAGTTAAGLRAGRPTLICPFFADQPFWGERVHALGVGPEPLPQKKLTVEGLAERINTVTTDTAMQRRAAKIGARLRAEDGVANGVRIIEEVVHPADPGKGRSQLSAIPGPRTAAN
jgi:sterol 3beta-glucosyltransferase